MNHIYTTQTKLLAIVLFASVSMIAKAQDIPFNCDFNAYLFQYNDIYAIDLASGNSYQVAEDITSGNINAAAYNPADGFIWGSLSSPTKSIVRIGKNFTTTTYYIDELPTNNRYVGDISVDGIYYLKGGGSTYYKLDLNPESTNYGGFLATGTLSQSISIHDWAFNAVDGLLYTVEKNTNKLYRINPSNGQITSLGVVPILAGNNYTYGAVYFDSDGRFYISANQTGTIYVIQNVQDISSTADMISNLFAFGPSSASNDGARCPTAPVPQEICDNGIDDDGDGLIDCQDPSCSGFGLCDVVEPPTASANAGGLESTNRLSEQINQRNFNRAKVGYTFNRVTAERVTRGNSYEQRSIDGTFSIEDFIPFNVIGETETINSTPHDLVNITNATEIFAVDYMNNDIPIASILALKTENGVYEHTKYICDRLLGAELISVSTISINDQPFIKSIIKNIDGTYEFVLSLSSKVVNADQNFAIESHWNLDKYEDNVSFYNFQIWANSVDDLYLLGSELLNLINVEKPISDYNNSAPPTVFVRKGKYENGALDLQIINTNATAEITLDAGLRVTETSDFENLTTAINLNAQYITNISVETGSLFDIGFRIGDGSATPDDLFMSDGPWGVDNSQAGTSVDNYQVTANTTAWETDEFPIERNVVLQGTTDTYIAVYRALTPRFKAVDLSQFNSLKLNAKGTGSLEITFVKQSVSNWDEQFKAIVFLQEDLQDYTILFSDLQNSLREEALLNDVVTIVFTMSSKDGIPVVKEMDLQDLRFGNANALTTETFVDEDQLGIYPNPMSSKATLSFVAIQSEKLRLVVYDRLGKLVYEEGYTAQAGRNSITLYKQNLSTGLYFVKILGQQFNGQAIKLIVN